MGSEYDVFPPIKEMTSPRRSCSPRLKGEAGLRPFLGKWQLRAGMSWQPELENAIDRSASAAKAEVAERKRIEHSRLWRRSPLPGRYRRYPWLRRLSPCSVQPRGEAALHDTAVIANHAPKRPVGASQRELKQ
jgi:hypothetical protein